MIRTIEAFFDGRVLRPSSAVDLTPNKTYLLSIRDPEAEIVEGDAWDLLESFAGTIEGPEDWAEEHDHYLYGVPKRQE